MPRLKMLRGPSPNHDFDLDENVITIGRGRKNGIIIQDNEVSRTHCRLVRVLDDYEIHDLGSTNGTFVNGQKIDESGWLLSERCIVELGDSITLEYQPNEASTATLPPIVSVTGALKEKTYYLVIKQKSQETPEIYVLDRPTITIGRDVDNDIVLDEPEVSRHHMRLTLEESGYTIEDLNTVNGTSINTKHLEKKKRLKPSDVVAVGDGVSLWYTDDPDSIIENLNHFDETDIPSLDDTDGAQNTDNSEPKPPTEKKRTTDINIQLGHGLEHGDLEKSVFLLYAREEWNVIGRHIYTYLDDNHIKVFTDQYLTPQTTDWDSAIEQALAESPCVLAIVSEKSIDAPHVIRSIRHFLAREKSVLLLKYGSITKLPMILQNMPAIKFTPQNPDKTYRMILAELRRIGL